MTQNRKPSRSSSGARKPAAGARKPAARRTSSTGRTVASGSTGKRTTKPSLKKRNTAAPQEPTDYNAIIAKHREWLKGDNIFILETPWEARLAMQTFGAQYHSGLKVVTYQGGVLRAELAPYKSQDFSYERWVEDDLNRKRRPIEYPTKFMKPRPHQEEAIKKIARSAKAGWRGFILADDVGIGKTIEAVIGASIVAQIKGFSEANPAKLLITCPKSVISHWRNTIKALGIKNLRVMILNYEQTKRLLNPPASAALAKKQKTKNSQTLSKGTPSIKWDIIIGDESHKLKNISQRSAAFGRISRYAASAETAPFVIWCSATIGQTPLELMYLAPLIGQMHGVKINQSTWGDWLMANSFSIRKTEGGNYVWVSEKKNQTPQEIAEVRAARQRDIRRLSAIVFDSKAPSIRRVPEDINGWPSQTHITVSQSLTTEESRLYQEIWNQFRSYLNLNPRGKNPKGGLAATLRFRQKASLIRAPHTVDYAVDLLENDRQLLISVEFLESLDHIKEELTKKGYKVSEFSGRNISTREEERISFQKGHTQVMLFTVTESVNFHAGEQLADGTTASRTKRETIIHDVRYSGLDTIQTMGRGTREGQLANSHFMYAEGTIETRILAIVLDKVKNMKILSADDEETINEIQNLLDSAA